MILSKSALAAAALIAAVDKPETVYLIDGACYAVNRKAWLLLSPIAEETLRAVPVIDSGNCTTAISAEALRQVLKLLPKDTLFKGLLEHADVRVLGGARTLEWTVSDGRRSHSMHCAAEQMDVSLITALRTEWATRWQTAEPARVSALNLKRLKLLLDALQQAGCSLSGEEPCWTRCCADGTVLMRAINHATHLRALGLCMGYDAEEGASAPLSAWERTLFERKQPTGPIRRQPNAIQKGM